MTQTNRFYWITLLLTGLALLAVVPLGLLPALLAGLLIYQLVEFGTRLLGRVGVLPATGKIILVVLVSAAIISLITLGILAVISLFARGPESLMALFQKMADVVVSAKTYMPLWLQEYLPDNLDGWQIAIAEWLRGNASQFSVVGREAGAFLAHLIIGMVIGGMVALKPGFQEINGPLAKAMSERVAFLETAFQRIVFSQVRISALNTGLTAIFLLVVLPLTGNPLPLAKTMVVVTFVVGLLPIIGNLISNTIIFLIAISVSPMTAMVALFYLVVIHKLEYFVNARIIGTRIHARAWEILIAMLVMEVGFGLPGLVAAPIYYAYLKDELAAHKLI